MLIKAEQRYVRQSPTKLRFVAQTIKGIKSPEKALYYLENIPKAAAVPLAKTLKQALANAKHNHGISIDALTIREFSIGEGPVYKRGIPVSKGRFHPIIKKTAHIRIILEDSVKVVPTVSEMKAEKTDSLKLGANKKSVNAQKSVEK